MSIRDVHAPSATAGAGLDRLTLAVFAVIALLTLVRIAGLLLAPVDLHGDEAQYWVWSRTLDWGYYSKPPLVAWAIAATTAAFGDAEWAVRLAAPLAHAGAAIALFALGRRMYGPLVGAWAGLGWAIMPAVWLSASVISTDALMLPSIAVALYALWRLREAPSLAWGAAFGAACGVGFLAKYGMLFFFGGAGLAAVAAPSVRRALLSPAGAVAAAAFALVAAPNLLWNAANGGATIAHTAANANLGAADLFNPDKAAEFLSEQLIVMGPLLFPALLALLALAALRRWRVGERELFLMAFVLPPLVIILGQAFVSRAHANWAAAAYPAAMVLVSAALWEMRHWRWVLWTSAGVHLVIGVLFIASAASPAFAERWGSASAFREVRYWDQTTAAILARYEAGDYRTIMVNDRMLYNSLRYQLRDHAAAARLRMWRLYAEPRNEAEAASPMTAADESPVLVVSLKDHYRDFIARDFESLEPLGVHELPVGGGRVRHIAFYAGRGFSPAPRDAEFDAMLHPGS